MKRRPPYFTNGMPRRVSSSSSWSRVVAGAEQHGLGAELHALLARRKDAFADLARLLAFVAGEHQLRRLAALALGPQPLGEAEAVLLGDGVCDGEDRRGGAVVLLERHRVRAGELLGEIEDVPGARRAKPVDRLEVVADDRQARMSPAQLAHDVDLQPVDVLVLVHEDVVEAVRDARPDHLVGR